MGSADEDLVEMQAGVADKDSIETREVGLGTEVDT